MSDDKIVSLIRFEEEIDMPYADDLGALDELFAAPACAHPTRENGPVGFAATFAAGASDCVQAKDLTVGGTILPRDLTVSAILRWDITAQNAAGTTGTIIARGLGTGATEYMPFALELHVINVATRLAEVRWLWHTAAGVLKTETGGQFIVPPDAAPWFILTATRRWVSPTHVVIRYYVNDQLLGEVVSLDGDIAASVDGTTTIGGRYTGAAYANFFIGAIDELAIFSYEMCLEEIQATVARIADHQLDGGRLIRELMPPGMPISDDPASRVQGDLSSIGVALGFAMGLVENFRQNVMPDRAYGNVLRRWERITRQPSKPGDALDTRRGRVVGHMRGRAGVSVPGVQTALSQVLDTDGANLQAFAFDNTIRDAFAAVDSLKWRYTDAADWTVLAGASRFQVAAGTYAWDPDVAAGFGKSAMIACEPPRASLAASPLNQLSMAASVTRTTLPQGAEAGLVYFDWINNHALFFGMKNAGGVYQVGYQRYEYGVATDAAWQVLTTPGAVTTWFRIRPSANQAALPGPAFEKYDLSYATASPASEALYTTAAAVPWMRSVGWAGLYFRTHGAIAGAADVRFGDFALRNGLGTRPFYFYVYRDPALGGNPDVLGAERILARMKHAFTKACVTTAKIALFDDPASTFDCTPLGTE